MKLYAKCSFCKCFNFLFFSQKKIIILGAATVDFEWGDRTYKHPETRIIAFFRLFPSLCSSTLYKKQV